MSSIYLFNYSFIFYAAFILSVFFISKNVAWPNHPSVGKVLMIYLVETLVDFFLTLQEFIYIYIS